VAPVGAGYVAPVEVQNGAAVAHVFGAGGGGVELQLIFAAQPAYVTDPSEVKEKVIHPPKVEVIVPGLPLPV